MPWTTAPTASQSEQLRRQLTARLRKLLPERMNRRIGWPSGSSERPVRFAELRGKDVLWWSEFPHRDIRVNLFGFGNPESRAPLSIAFQFNLRAGKPDRALGGLFATRGAQVMLAHRAIATRVTRISKARLLAFRGFQRLQVDDLGKEATVLKIASLGSRSLVPELRRFATKFRVAAESIAQDPAAVRPPAGRAKSTLPTGPLGSLFQENTAAFKTAARARGRGKREHGAVVNALGRLLRPYGERRQKNVPVDLAILGDRGMAIFEVKTRTRPGPIYEGIGQLLFHGHQYGGHTRTLRYLVLPAPVTPNVRDWLRGQCAIHPVVYKHRGQRIAFPGLKGELQGELVAKGGR
jgi:hypothetical protein